MTTPALTETFNSLTPKLGQAFGKLGAGKLAGVGAGSKAPGFIILLVLTLPIGAVLLGIFLLARKKKPAVSVVRERRGSITAKIVLILLVVSTAILLGLAGLTAYNYLKEHRISIAAGSRTAESYALVQALKTVTERYYPRIKITILEIEGAAKDAGLLERGLVQLATAQSDIPTGPSARSVAVLSVSTPQLLLARKDVDERVVYALTQVLMQRGQELAAALPAGKAAPQPLAANVRRPDVKAKSDAPLHLGAVAFYDRDKIPFVFRYFRLIALVSAGLVLLGLWTWQLRRRARRKQIIQTIRFSPPADREPWTFSKILLESAGETSAPIAHQRVQP